MEASTLQAPVVTARSGPSIGASLLRLRSDEQLVALFRSGNDDAFRTIHDRYRQRLFAYTRQMLPGRQDAEDALQDVFVRAYSGLRANDRDVALRAWLYRVAHNRCVDELRRPLMSPTEVFELISAPGQDPVAQADQRESLRRLIADVRRLPQQQRSALLMRELSGMSYAELAGALGTTVPAVKSLLVRARMALAQALEARDTACHEIRDELIVAQDNRVRPNAMSRRHMRDCPGCREFRRDLRGVSRQLSALVPTLGPIGVLANLIGFGVGGGAGGGGTAAVGGATVAAGGAAGTGGVIGTGGALASAGALATGAGHVATLLVATVVTAGGAVEIQKTIAPTPVHHHRARHAAHIHQVPSSPPPAARVAQSYTVAPAAPVIPAPVIAPAPGPVHAAVSATAATTSPAKTAKTVGAKSNAAKSAKGSKTSTSQTASGSGTDSTTSSSSTSSTATASSSATTGTSSTATGPLTGTSGTDSTTTGTSSGTTSSGTSSSTSSTTTGSTQSTSAAGTPASPAGSPSDSSTSEQSTSGGTSSPTNQ